MGEKQSNKRDNDEKYSLKGTFISVMLLGVFIILSWAGVFALFVSR